MIYKGSNATTSKVVVPEHLQAVMCYLNHNMELSAHQGAKRAIAAITRNYYWPSIPAFVRKYAKSCSYCTRAAKPAARKTQGSQ